MPPYEFTVYYKPLIKDVLVEVIKRTATKLLDNDAVIIDLKSLGYRDLATKTTTRLEKERVFTANSMLFHTSMSNKAMLKAKKELVEDKNLLRVAVVNLNNTGEPPAECDLEKSLLSPAYRESVTALRRKKKMSYVMAFKTYKRTEKEFKNIPKSYWVSQTLP